MELLIVIAIIVLLLSIMLPSLTKAKEQGRRILCANNLRQWGVALQCYRNDYNDFIPTEGTYLGSQGGVFKRYTWYNELPSYISAPAYKDIEGVNVNIKESPNLDVWVCPSKNLTNVYKSLTGKNQFHYGMNMVLDGMGKAPHGSADTPGFPDHDGDDNGGTEELPFPAKPFAKFPNTVYLFDIAPNQMRGSPRDVATEHWQDFEGKKAGKFHGNFANLLYMNGGVTSCKSEDLVEKRDNRRGRILWNHPRLYWGYPRPDARRGE
ncbi:MAG: type II secretion system protein [Planctomycetota bacterium]